MGTDEVVIKVEFINFYRFYIAELLKTYQGENVRLESGSTGTILQLDGKRITISNAIVVTEEE